MPSTPGVHLRALATWLAVYPLITAVLWATRPLLRGAPLPAQTLVLTALVVPAAVYGAVPALLRLLTTGALLPPAATPATTTQEDHP